MRMKAAVNTAAFVPEAWLNREIAEGINPNKSRNVTKSITTGAKGKNLFWFKAYLTQVCLGFSR